MAKLEDLIEILTKKADWDAECRIEGYEGSIKVVEITDSKGTTIDLICNRGPNKKTIVRDVIKSLIKDDWDTEIKIDGVRGEVQITEVVISGKVFVDICSVKGGH